MGFEIVVLNLKIPGIAAFQTTISGGVSEGPYQSLNLGLNSGDDPGRVLQNRKIVEKRLHLPSVCYMHQVHGNLVCRASDDKTQECDGLVTTASDLPLAVLTADCLPVLLASSDGAVVAAVHCGWRSLQSGIIKNAVAMIKEHSNRPVRAAFGACIGPMSYEVDDALKDKFGLQYEGAFAQAASKGHCLFDLRAAALIDLKAAGAELCDSCNADTLTDRRFYSYRRNKTTGRMACVIVKMTRPLAQS